MSNTDEAAHPLDPPPPPGTFRRRSTVRRLTFEPPHELAGLFVRVRGLSVDEMLQITGFSRAVALLRRETAALEAGEATELRPEVVSVAANLDADAPFRIFADKLVEWNMVDDLDEPVPANLAGVLSCEPDEVNLIIKEWISSFTGVSDDLKDVSNNGRNSAVVPLPMEPL